MHMRLSEDVVKLLLPGTVLRVRFANRCKSTYRKIDLTKLTSLIYKYLEKFLGPTKYSYLLETFLSE